MISINEKNVKLFISLKLPSMTVFVLLKIIPIKYPIPSPASALKRPALKKYKNVFEHYDN